MIRLRTVSANNGPLIFQVDNNFLPNSTGQVRWNGTTKEFEVSDNFTGNWQRINPDIELRNSIELENMMSWVKKKMQEEKELQELIQQYPSLENAHKQFLTVYTLVKQNHGTSG